VSKVGGLTPRPENEANHEVEVEVIEPISRVEDVVESDNNEYVVKPSKKNRKRDRSTRRSHSSFKRHRHTIGSSSQPLPDSIFAATTRFSEYMQTNLVGTSYIMLKTYDIPSLVDSIVELTNRALLIGKMIKEESTSDISSPEFEKLKTELAESNGKLNSLTAQVKELSTLNVQHEAEKELLKDEIADLTAERLKLDDENQHLKEKLSDLSTAKEVDSETIHLL